MTAPNPSLKSKAKALAPQLRPLDFDDFERAIAKDWSMELQNGSVLIQSLPTEFVGEVRQDLIRLAAWANCSTSRLLLVLLHGSYTHVLDKIQAYCNTYEEFKSVCLLVIDDPEFEDKFEQVLETQANQKMVICIPFESFSTIRRPQTSEIELPKDDPAWNNYTMLAEVLPHNGMWHTLAYGKNGDSSLVRIVLLNITMALIYDRITDNEGQ